MSTPKLTDAQYEIPNMSTLTTRRVTAIIFATASVYLAPHATSAQTAAVKVDATTCVACHGTHGEGARTGVPRLAGQDSEYMSHALSMFKAGTRVSAIMQPIARNLSDSDMRALADHFSTQHAPLVDAVATVSPQLVLAGKQLAEAGAANVIACFSCHGEQGKGNGARFPAIAGQPATFIVNRLHEFQARARGSTPKPGTMTAVAAMLGEKQIEAAAAYLSQLTPLADSDEVQEVTVVTAPLLLPERSNTHLSRAGIGSIFWAARHPARSWRVFLPVQPGGAPDISADIKARCTLSAGTSSDGAAC